MLQSQQVEELIRVVSAMDRTTVIEQFHTYRATFPVDFTDDFLVHQTTEQLQHLFLAMCLQSQRMPDMPNAA